jgi:hypothetical protein
MRNIYDKYREQGRRTDWRFQQFVNGEITAEEYGVMAPRLRYSTGPWRWNKGPHLGDWRTGILTDAEGRGILLSDEYDKINPHERATYPRSHTEGEYWTENCHKPVLIFSPANAALIIHAPEMYELLDMLDDIGLAAAIMDDDEFVKIRDKIGDVLRKIRKTAGFY